MAILPRYPGFEVTVEVNGIPLPEHAPVKIVEANAMPTDDAESAPTATPLAATSIVKYVESPLCSEFTIRYKCTPGFGYASDHIYLEPSLDGKAILVPDLRYSPEHGCDSQVCYGGASWQGDAMRTQRFRFAELDIVEDQTTDEMRRVLLDQGEIKLDFFFTNEGQTVTATDLPPLVFDNIEKPVSAKAVKETLARTGCMPVQSAGLAPAVDRMGGHLEEVKTVGKLGTFIFKYRTTNALKDLGVVPPTVPPTPSRSPTPLLERDESDMTLDELRQLCGQLRQQRHDQMRIKRERGDSDDTVVSKNELQWMGTKPCAKKLRAMPTASDEVIELDK